MGCRLNHAETAMLHSSLERAGYEIVPWGCEAELMVLNSCTVTRHSEAKGRQALRSMRRRFPGARLAVVGCYAQTGSAALAEAGLADVIVGNGRKLQLAEILDEEWLDDAPLVDLTPLSRAPFALDVFAAPEVHTRGNLKVQDGCDFMCSFCIIPVARGRARPRILHNLLAEAEHLAAAGVRELVLTGVNLGTYLHEGTTLAGVVDALDRVPGLDRIRISSIEPTTVAPELLERMADPAHHLVPFLHLPLQSGSARVLHLMRRRYAPQQFRRFAERALAQVPDLCLGTDVMVGFPGEDESAFEETRSLLTALPFAYCHVFPFSQRPGTRAARLPESVSTSVRDARAALLRGLSDRLRRKYHERFRGSTRQVLFESGGPAGMARGLTDNYIRVEVPAPRPQALRNRLLPVRLDEAGTRAMAGTLLE